MKKRKAGILLPITSLASDYGIGCFSKEAYEFADFLEETEQSFWQILPIGPTGFGDSPYQSFSSYGGNPYMIDLGEFIKDGILSEQECGVFFEGDIDYGRIFKERYKALRLAFKRTGKTKERIAFAEKNAFWLDDYTLFSALKSHFGNGTWQNWDSDAKMRRNLDFYRDMLWEEIEFHEFLQYEFFSQWERLKKYVNSKGIKIIGDLPIYVSADSTDFWQNPHLFQTDENLVPTAVAGCPPDGFSPNGQMWGNPLYDWKKHEENGFGWWIDRTERAFDLFDVVRIDHFRGFDEYYSVPFGAENAKKGEWKKAPGEKLFKEVKKAVGEREFIAEDLGFVTNSVKKLLESSGFPGMKVLQFAFDENGAEKDGLPHNYNANCVAYTGTHDNDTIVSWFEKLPDNTKSAVRKYLCDYYTPNEKINLPLIGLIMRSDADLCVIPMQDYMGLRDNARINTPSTLGNNWKWRLKKGEINFEIAKNVLNMTKMSGRCR